MSLHNLDKIAACAALLIFASTATAAEPKSKPFDLTEVGFTADCNPNDALQRLIGIIAGGNDPDLAVYEAVSGEIERELFLDEPVSWNGLKLTSVHLYTGIERGPVNYSLEFADSVQAVRTIWNALGWNLPAVDDSRDVKGLEGYASIGVRASGPDKDRARITCWRD